MGTLKGVVLVSTTLLLATARASEAAPITFVFEGHLTTVASDSPASVGDTFSGSFTYDSDAAATRTPPGQAFFDDGLIGLDFALGGWSGSASAPAVITPPLAPLGVTFDVPFSRDLLFVQDIFDTSTTVIGHTLTGILLTLGDDSRSVFSSPILPLALDLTAFDLRRVSISWDGPFTIDIGEITRLERRDVAVPEPSTLGLAGTAGLIGLLRRRRRSRRRNGTLPPRGT